MKRYSKSKKIAAALLALILVAGCSANTSETAATTAASSSASAALPSGGSASAAAVQLTNVNASETAGFNEDDALTSWSEDGSTAITLNGSGAAVEGSGAKAEGNVVTISEAGTYIAKGTFDGQIVVNAPKDAVVHLVLNGVQIHNDNGPAIHVKEADKTIVTLPEGTDNALTDGATYADTSDDAPTAALYSKGDLTINGAGKLSVQGNANDGITSKDDLKIMSGTISVKAADDGLIGRDLFAVQDGSITIEAGGDGVKTTNDTDENKGKVVIAGGTLNITSANDGIQSAASLLIGGGTFRIVTGGGSAASTKTHQDQDQGPRGFNRQAAGQNPNTAGEQTQQDDSESPSAKALKAAADMTISGGDFEIDAADDAIHSNANIAILGGKYSLATGDDGIHADTSISISDGTIEISKSYEGIESMDIAISGGTIHLVASDDGLNGGGGSDSAEGGKGMSGSANGMLTISGGYVYVDAEGDGLDSNGSVSMTGGTVIVNGPTRDGNGALDYDGTFDLSGGTLIAAGSSGMAQAPSETSPQRSFLMTFPSTLEGGTLVTITDGSGAEVAAFAPAKAFSSIVVSGANLKAGEEYTISTGGASSGTVQDGMYQGGTVSGSAKVVTFKLGDTVTYVNESGVTTANTGMGPGGGRGPGGAGGQGRPAGGGREAGQPAK
ncbi:carbohydrate-binding domain-containing protein [Paenibacillus doosanensis]|uniref:carbohydrate-binding domain-containing protein n=1 Tax=Paenibacillus doosanensis TaxID=1229154 RepID=UPI00217FA0DA|nr:carbohydrate-binding domain-containing protein [Paenibacillus doosanensis]MCS7462269.1 carbohydrate-binding domain-containing protein [Paenibacillus doosanensis]